MKNGITPTIACYLKIGVGASDEPFDQAGTAHFLEHLLFKGTLQLGTTDFSKEKIYLKQIFFVGERIDRNQQYCLTLFYLKIKNGIILKIKKDKSLLKSLHQLVRKFIVSEEDSQAYSLAGQVGYNAYTSADVTTTKYSFLKIAYNYGLG